MNRTVWQIAAIYSASALGVSYLGGAEWLRFFSFYGTWGLIGIALGTIGLTWLTDKTILMAVSHHRTTLDRFLALLVGEKAAPTVTFLLYTLILIYAGLSVGETAALLTRDATFALLLLIGVFASACLLLRIPQSRLISLFTFLFIVALSILIMLFLLQPHVPLPSLAYQLNANWFLYACFYVAFHYVFQLVILFAQIGQEPKLATLRSGIWLGGALLLLLVGLGNLNILSHWHEVNTSSQPLIQILSQFSTMSKYGIWIHSFLQLLLLLAFWFYGLAAPLAQKHDLRHTPLYLLFAATALVFSPLPFFSQWYSMIVYAITTYAGIALLFLLLWKRSK
ncbi:hypothetical protein [Brevibacillus migulae]|uniref:hypothetical protein n=1 Tax=Brevibacillus migulae TaxID=1644114 RepID=UPI00106E0A94|nr:hypothetical protein [Brevibacillus migulae]